MNFCVLLLVFALFCYRCNGSDAPSNSLCSAAECINNGNGDLSSAILCNNCLKNVLSNRNTAASIVRENQLDNFGRKRLDDLDCDVLFLIFDELHILEILNLLSGYPSKKFSALANEIFRKRYRDYNDVHVDRRDDLKRIDFNQKLKKIMISPNKLKEFMRHFGSFVQHLEIEHPSNVTTPCINEYASDALISLKMTFVETDTFSYFTKPFTQLQSLVLHLARDVHFNYTRYDFPILKHLEVKDSLNLADIRLFEEFFRRNSDLQSLKISRLNQATCNMIIEHLKNLEYLDVMINEFKIDNETTFEHVRHLSVGPKQFKSFDDGPGTMDKLHLPRLESLQIKFDPFLDVWKVFCQNHQTVKKVEIIDVFARKDEELDNVLAELPKLIEIILKASSYYNNSISSEFIRRIIDWHKDLVKFKLLNFNLKDSALNNANSRFRNHWYINAEEDLSTLRTSVSFESKNLTY